MAFDDMGGGDQVLAQINVTPLVDVMLVLLVIFMVAAPVIQQGVEIELPEETIAPIEGEGEQLVVSVSKDGSVFIGEENKIEAEKVGPKVAAILESKTDKRVFIRADKNVSYGEVMTVMAGLRRSNVLKVGLMTDPEG